MLAGVLVLLGALSLWAIIQYNRLVALRERAEGAWGDIDAQLKRRHDLIPSLVETVKGYAFHERSTLEQVVARRAQAAQSRDQGPGSELADRENLLAASIRRLFALAEGYPQLRASERFGQLQQQLVEIERHLQDARRYYNAVVRDLNTSVARFPTLLVARAAGITPREFFELRDPAERSVTRVRLDGART